MRHLIFVLLALSACTDPPPNLAGPDASVDASSDVLTHDQSSIDSPDAASQDLGTANNVNACPDRLDGSGIAVGPQGLMIQVPSVQDICELERTLDHVCEHHNEIADLVLTSVETWENGEVRTALKLDVLEAIAPYFSCFANVFVGTVSEILLDDPYAASTINDPDKRWEWILAARQVATPIAEWMDVHHGGVWHWYISYEANLNAFTDTAYRNAYIAMLQQHITDIAGINDGVVSWSPTFWTPPSGLNATARTTLTNALTNTFDRVPVDWVLIQDHLGVQPSWTCQDALLYYDIVRTAGPNLASVQLNVEYFTIDANGIGNGDPQDLAERVTCYQNAGASIGASFEYRYWYETHGH